MNKTSVKIIPKTLSNMSSVLSFISYEVIDKTGKPYKLSLEQAVSFETYFERHNPSSYGVLMIVDRLDINKVVDLKTSSVKVYYVDLYNNFFYRVYKVINSIESTDSKGIKTYELKLRDNISYFLDNLYISKSFNGSRVKAFKQIMEEYNLNTKLQETKLNFTVEEDSTSGGFALNKNLSVLDFFEKEFERIGFSFYQDKGGFYVKDRKNLLPDKLTIIKDSFSQMITNPLYKNKIYEFMTVPAQKEVLDNNPKQQSFYYDIEKRKMVSINDNFNDVKGDITMNRDNVDIQETVGFKAKFQNRYDSAQQKNSIIEQYLRLSVCKIVTNSYVENDINKVIDIELLGDKGNVHSQISGDIVASGKYVILSITDRVIGDKMLSLIEAGRSDAGKVGKN